MQKYKLDDFLARFINEVDELEFYKVIDELPDFLPNDMWLAGGALRRTLIGMDLNSDFDLFFRNSGTLASYAKALETSGATKTASNEHQITYCINVNQKPRIIQLVRIGYYLSPEELINSFDFTITQFATDGDYLLECCRFLGEALKKDRPIAGMVIQTFRQVS